MKRILSFILASNLMMLSVASGQAGKTGLSFLKLGAGGRPLGMGEAHSAIVADPTATVYNPGALAWMQNSQILLMHKEWVQDMKTEFLGATTTWKKLHLGLSLNSTSIDNIESRTQPGPPIGTFDAKNVSIGLSAAVMLSEQFGLGLTGKFLYEKIYADEASGYGIDIGGLYKLPWNQNLAFGVYNIGSMNTLSLESTKIPTSVRAGSGYKYEISGIKSDLVLAADLVSYLREKENHLHIGAEFNYDSTLSLRFGYQTGYEARNYSTGVGFHYSLFSVDYAFVPFNNGMGTTHTISLTIEFK